MTKYSQADLDAVSDNPEWTAEDFKRARPFGEVFPRLSRGRPPLAEPKVQVTVRLDADVLAGFKATGPGWQSRINAALRAAIGRGKANAAE